MPETLSRQEARRIAVRAQLLDEPRPTDLLETVRHLTLLQADMTAAIAPAPDLMLGSRLGGYEPDDLITALEVERVLVELEGMIRPADDLRLYLDRMRAAPRSVQARDWIEDNAGFRDDVLALLADEGPLTAREVPDTSVVDWPSSGWNANRNATMMLELLERRGEVAVSSRRGATRVWDLAERVHPAGIEPLPEAEAFAERNRRRLRSLGVMRVGAYGSPGEPLDVGDEGEEVRIEGVRGRWRVDPIVRASLAEHPLAARTVLLSPFDRLVQDRKRAEALFGFEFALGMYTPKHKRRWGYFPLPILHGDRLVGKLDATADRAAGVLRVHAVHEDEPFDRGLAAAVDAEVDALAAWLELRRA
ncbi:DNA glycosylase AlkZ-like family protein [Agromyces sp. SYSU T00194]|uniref:DNA glycosylase AlkZ-like family protein n=1 Tax=Agromyces chitinivorans TaxID=3158560 RepID=UPI00339769B2